MDIRRIWSRHAFGYDTDNHCAGKISALSDSTWRPPAKICDIVITFRQLSVVAAFLLLGLTGSNLTGAQTNRGITPEHYFSFQLIGDPQNCAWKEKPVFSRQGSGTRIVFVSHSGPSDGILAADRMSDVRHYTHIIYKFNDTGWVDGKRQHLWIVNVQDGEARQITEGQDSNDTDPQWSPDGTRIALVSDRTGKAYDNITNNTDVFVVPASGESLTKISDHDFADESPRWSPDDKQILCASKTAYHQFPKLYIADSSSGRVSQLAVNDLNLIPTELKWPWPRSVLFQARVRDGNSATSTRSHW
jgi:WD40-like Beta Propeller Repeat